MHGECGEVTAMRGKVHKCSGMKTTFKDNCSMEINVRQQTEDMLRDFLMKFKLDGKCTFLAGKDMFSEE